LASEDITVAKLTEIRHRYLQDLELCRRKHREERLGEIVDIVLADPYIGVTPQAATSKPAPESVMVVQVPDQAPPPKPAEVTPAVEVTLAPPEKQPLKSYRVNVYGHCPECQSPIFEAQAKFCSQCANPLDEM
jgi:hypothetical protein